MFKSIEHKEKHIFFQKLFTGLRMGYMIMRMMVINQPSY